MYGVVIAARSHQGGTPKKGRKTVITFVCGFSPGKILYGQLSDPSYKIKLPGTLLKFC